jgi:HSP20 family protein
VARIYFERRDFDARREFDSLSDEIQRFFAWHDDAGAGAVAEYRPPVDVIETAESIEVIADLPGVRADALRVVFTQNALVVAGQKVAPVCLHREAAFHLAERTFGRFACLVRVAFAVDAGRARATIREGELHITLPRLEDRRGRDIQIKVESA